MSHSSQTPMSFFRKNPIFYSTLLLLAGACLVGGWYLATLRGALSELKAAYQTKASQYQRYLTARPSPTRSNLEAIEANYDELHAVYEEALGNLHLSDFDADAFFGPTPSSKADWSFELHKFRENARYAALSNSIALSDRVEFGFGDYSNGGPPAEEMKEVHEQIVIMSSLLNTLFGSGIGSFEAIQRGVKSIKKGSSAVARRAGGRLFADGDQFLVEPGESVAVPGTIDSHVFRLVFRGQSIALRNFLNRVSRSQLPFVIRGVEADLSSEGGEKSGLESIAGKPFAERGKKPAGQASAVPIISDNTSLFVVTIEFLQLTSKVEKARVPGSKRGGEDA